MKKIMALLLLIVSKNVFAEWTKVTDSSDGDMTVYVDYGSIKKKGNKVKILDLTDFKTVQKTKSYRYLSQLSLNEYDCEKERRRMLDFHWFSENMKKGDIVYSEKNINDEGKSIPTDSIGTDLFNIACDNK
jgi:hypothetical protein